MKLRVLMEHHVGHLVVAAAASFPSEEKLKQQVPYYDKDYIKYFWYALRILRK